MRTWRLSAPPLSQVREQHPAKDPEQATRLGLGTEWEPRALTMALCGSLLLACARLHLRKRRNSLMARLWMHSWGSRGRRFKSGRPDAGQRADSKSGVGLWRLWGPRSTSGCILPLLDRGSSRGVQQPHRLGSTSSGKFRPLTCMNDQFRPPGRSFTLRRSLGKHARGVLCVAADLLGALWIARLRQGGTVADLMVRLPWLGRLLDWHDERVLVVTGSCAVVEAQRAFVAGDHGDGHHLDAPAGEALAGGVQ